MVKEISIVICGQAGQGIKTVEKLLSGIMKRSGLHIFACKEFMSRIRGGMNSTSIRISSLPVRGFVDTIDILVPLDPGGIEHVKNRISSDTLIIGELENIGREDQESDKSLLVPLSAIAREMGNAAFSNTVAVGVLAALVGSPREVGTEFIRGFFSSKGAEVAEKNIAAFGRGYDEGSIWRAEAGGDRFQMDGSAAVRKELLMSGTEGVGLGAIAGGCNFLAFYPMSPATGVGIFIAKQADKFGILVEQAEDEIAAINMVAGGWYAGGRGMTTTSGGGFALMTEGLSLAAMLETPIVIHLAQRPGPATGLPTRTGQEDLLFVLFSGHGEFPRVVYGPGSIEEAFALTRKAFNMADKFQVPVIILTDQYLLDSTYNLPPPEIDNQEIIADVVRTDPAYLRYQLTDNGISPRGIPGYGDGLVAVDSDEHDESGHITENLGIRVQMVDKRLKKLNGLTEEIIPPVFFGDNDFQTLILGWGSTMPTIREALEEIGTNGIGYLHFSQVFPLWPTLPDYLYRADRTIVVENNATGQFAKLITMTTGQPIDGQILKYNGLPFSLEEMIRSLNQEVMK
jgi:2-oxoglutarate/2-oxoacid ferredoxin oxidoreductase subunit alpha